MPLAGLKKGQGACCIFLAAYLRWLGHLTPLNLERYARQGHFGCVCCGEKNLHLHFGSVEQASIGHSAVNSSVRFCYLHEGDAVPFPGLLGMPLAGLKNCQGARCIFLAAYLRWLGHLTLLNLER